MTSLLCTALVPFCLLSKTVIKAAQPNIILVMADHLGWSDVGCFGGEIRTPHIDSLAREGLRFTQFYSKAVCGPTRASLLTGLYCQQAGKSGDHWNQPKDYSRFVLVSELVQDAERPTWARTTKQATRIPSNAEQPALRYARSVKDSDAERAGKRLGDKLFRWIALGRNRQFDLE